MSHDSEEMLREAFAAGSDGLGPAAPPTAGWADVLLRAKRLRTRRRVTAGAAALAAAAAGVAVVVGLSGRSDRDSIRFEVVDSTPDSGAPGGQIVVVTADRMLVMDARDGSTERVIGTGGPLGRGLMVLPDRRVVVGVAGFDESCRDVETLPGLQSFDLALAEPEAHHLGTAHRPQLGPDGESVAFGACVDAPNREEATAVLGIAAVGALDAGAFDRESEHAAPAGTQGTAPWVEPLGFVPSGRLLVRLSADWSRVYTVDPHRWGTALLGDEPPYKPFPLPADTTAVAVMGDTGRVAVARGMLGGSEVIAVDARTGDHVGRLFDLPEWEVETMRPDATGEHLVMTAAGVLSSQQQTPTVWRWSTGDTTPTELAEMEGLLDAAWLPEPAPTTPVTTALPVSPVADDEIVALRGELGLVGLAAGGTVVHGFGGDVTATDEDLHPAASAPGGLTIAVSPDRSWIYHDAHRVEGCGDSAPDREIWRKSAGDDPGELFAVGRAPEPSSDGAAIAYLRSPGAGPCSDAAPELVVRYLASGAERSWSLVESVDEPGVLAGPLGYLADSRRLVVRVDRGEATEWWIADTGAASGELEA